MQVVITDEAQKQYNHLPKPEQSKIKRKFSLLEANQNAGKKLSGRYSGLRSLRAWPYRIVYQVLADRKEIWVVSILHRQGAYK